MDMGRLNLNNYDDDFTEENGTGEVSSSHDDFMEDDTYTPHIILNETSYANSEYDKNKEANSSILTSSLKSDIQDNSKTEVFSDSEKIGRAEGEIIIEEDEMTEPEYEKFVTAEVIGGAYSRETYNASSPRKRTESSMSNIKVTTQTVAKALNVTEQTVRNYCKELSDYFNIEVTGSGRLRFTKKDIEDLRYVMKLKELNNFTMEQLKQYLLEDHYAAVSETKRLDRYAQNLEEKVLQLLADKLNSTTLLLQEQNDSRKQEQENMQRILSAFEQQNKDIEELKKNISEINEISKRIDDVNSGIDDSKSELERYKKENEELKRENEKLSIDNVIITEKVKQHEQTITELSQRKERKKIFGIF